MGQGQSGGMPQGLMQLMQMFPGMQGRGQPAPAAGNVPPPPPVAPPQQQMPGYAGRPQTLFGSLNEADLARYNQENNIALPRKPAASNSGPMSMLGVGNWPTK